jgi:uncharacterized protein (TIRG00374 family)
MDTCVKRRFITGALKYVLGFAVLAFVISHNWKASSGGAAGLGVLLDKPIKWTSFATATCVYAVAVFLNFIRWYVLTSAQRLQFNLAAAIKIGSVGFFCSTFMPGGIGGDVIRAFLVAQHQNRRTVAVSTVLIDRAVGLWSLVWVVFLFGGAFWLARHPVLLKTPALLLILEIATAATAGSASLWILAGVLGERHAASIERHLNRIPNVGRVAAELWNAIWIYRLEKIKMLLALAVSIGSRACFVIAFYFAAGVFDESKTPSLPECFLLVPMGTAIQALFPSPGGLGGSELGFGALYAMVGKPESDGILASLTQRVIIYCLSIVAFIIYLAWPSVKHNGDDLENATE